MRPARLWILTIVAVFPLSLDAAPAPIARVPVSTPVIALADRLGMDLERDQGRFVPEIIRRVYSPPPSRQTLLNLAVRSSGDARSTALVDVPLTPEIWSGIFKRAVPPDQLLATILNDRRAALLCRGLAAADDETLAFYEAHPALLAFIYERASPAFVLSADSLRVHDGHIVVPGGEAAASLWSAALHATTDDAELFIRTLLFEPDARSSYLYSVLDAATPATRAFALGTWIADPGLRARRFEALLLAIHTSYREWHADELPFARPLNDLAILLMRMRVEADGTPRAPADRRFWSQVFDANTASGPASETAANHPNIDAAWLLQATAGDMYARGDRLEQLAFGQRIFGQDADGTSDRAASALREMPTRRMLFLTLERLGITSPAVYDGTLRQARSLADAGADRFWTVAQLQGTLAIIVRMTATGTIDNAAAAPLVRSLVALELVDGDFRGRVADWFEQVLEPALPKGDTWQDRVIAAVAGHTPENRSRIEWEGQTYKLDLAFAERRRMEEVRARQGGPDLDLAFSVFHLARRAAQVSSADDARPIVAEAQAILASSASLLVRPAAGSLAAGVPLPRDGRDWLLRTADELDRAARAGDARRVARAADSLRGLGDVLLGHALLSFVYAMHLGDPDGPALLGANVALRHDFGFGRRDTEGRARGPWAQPRQDFQPGVPWHVVGSLLGLDAALAPLALHRLSLDGLPSPPRLPSIEREAFAVNVALLNPRRLTDGDQARLVEAIRNGRARVRAALDDADEFEKLERDLQLDGWRVRTVRWVMQNAPASMENQFSLAEFAALGGAGSNFDAWGASGLLSYGCLCLRFPEPRTWRVLAGRVQMAMMAASTVEMNLEMAQRLAALQLPAALLPSVLATAMQDFADLSEPADPNDIAALIRYPLTIDSNVVADYVAAAATLDGPLVSIDDVPEP